MERLHVILAVWKRNVSAYFSGVLGYLFIAVFVVAASLLAFNDRFFTENQCSLDQLSAYFPWLLLFIVPAVTMTLWAEERKLGTDELLFTLPARDWEILAGKYLAGLSIYTIALLFSGMLTVVLAILGDPDWRVLFSTFLGFWLAGAALLAAGMFASVLTSSATVAFLLGVLFASIPIGVDQLGLDRLLRGADVAESLTVGGRLQEFGEGLIPWGNVAYFLAVAAFFLYLNSVMIARRHWAGGPQATTLGWHYALRGLCLAIALGGGVYVLSRTTLGADMTSEKLYTPAEATTRALANIDSDRPVMMQAYISPEVPGEYVTVRKNLLTMLRQFESLGGRKLSVRIVETRPLSKESEEAEASGVVRREAVSERSGRFVRDDIYLGVVVSSGFDRVVVPYFEKGTPVEFELARAIRTVSQAKRKTVGVLTTDAKVMGGLDMNTFRQQPTWQLVNDLKKQYTVKEISPDEAISSDACDVLIAVLPHSLTQPQMGNLVDWVKRGGPTLLFDDPLPYFIDQSLDMTPTNPNKPSQGGGMMGMGGGAPGAPKADGGEALTLMDALEINWDVRSVIYDFHMPHPEHAERFPTKQLLFLTPAAATSPAAADSGLNPESSITKGLQEILAWFSGEIRPRVDSKLSFIPLLRTQVGTSGRLDFDDCITAGPGFPFGGGRMLNLEAADTKQPDRREHVVAAQILGVQDGGAKAVNAIFVADADIATDVMFNVSEQQFLDMAPDNVLFVLNCVDMLLGDTDFIALRNRRPIQRTLTLIDGEKTRFLEQAQGSVQDAQKAADEKLAAAKTRMTAEIKKLQEDKTIDAAQLEARLREREAAENRRLALEEREIKREAEESIRRVKRQSEENVKRIENGVKRWACAVPALPAVILGLVMLLLRLSGERHLVSADRMVRR